MGLPGHDPTQYNQGTISLSADEWLQLCTATKIISPDPSPELGYIYIYIISLKS